MGFWCWLFGHQWKLKNMVVSIGSGEPGYRGLVAVGVPEESEYWQCLVRGKEKYEGKHIV